MTQRNGRRTSTVYLHGKVQRAVLFRAGSMANASTSKYYRQASHLRKPARQARSLANASTSKYYRQASHLRKPARQARLLAKLDRAPERNILGDLSTGAQGKRGQQTRWSFDHSSASSAGVATGCDDAYPTTVCQRYTLAATPASANTGAVPIGSSANAMQAAPAAAAPMHSSKQVQSSFLRW